jgi:hypothetical protein
VAESFFATKAQIPESRVEYRPVQTKFSLNLSAFMIAEIVLFYFNVDGNAPIL